MPRLRVLAGPCSSSLTPITDIVNSGRSHAIRSDRFEGEIAVNIKGFVGGGCDTGYFEREDREGITWSIQVQGRFLAPYSSDDILFGNTFDKPIKLPWGSGAAFKFIKYIDPVLEHDLTSTTRPWALSPLIATMPHFTHHRLTRVNNFKHTFPPTHSIGDDISELHLAVSQPRSNSPRSSSSSTSSRSSRSPSFSSSSSSSLISSSSNSSTHSKPSSIISTLSSKAKNATSTIKKDKKCSPHEDAYISKFEKIKTANERRAYFSNAVNRKCVEFGPNDLITTDFCYGFLQFNPSLALSLPGGLSFDLMRYWDGQPVRFVCCERKHIDKVEDQGKDKEGGGDVEGNDSDPWGRLFWCVVIELEEECVVEEL